MGEVLIETAIVLSKIQSAALRGGAVRLRLALMLAACLVLAACADSDRHSGDNRFGGFYGGVSGGVSR